MKKSNFFLGAVNGCLLEIVGVSVVGLIITLVCGMPEIVAWLTK